MGKDEGGAAMEMGTELSGCIVMIPALDPGPDLAAYAAALLARGPEALVVVDDGSGPGSREVFAALEAMDRAARYVELTIKTTYSYSTDPREGVMLERTLEWLTRGEVSKRFQSL